MSCSSTNGRATLTRTESRDQHTSRRCADDIMTPSLPEDRFAWLNLVGNTMPPRDPNNGDDDEDDEEDEEDEDREPAVIREPDEDE